MLPDFSVGPFILMYHSIDEYPDDPYSVPVAAFREQISWLSGNGFEVVSLEFLLRSIQSSNYKVLRKKVVITFDDGCKDFVTNALPILQEFGAPATVFLVTEMFDGRTSWNEFGAYVPLMSEDEARYIKSQGISLGSHTATHVKMTMLDHEELLRQLKDSHDALTRLGESFYTLSYPWGHWSNQVVSVVKAEGFECALAVGEQTRMRASDIYCLPRVTMKRDMDLNFFQSRLTRTRVEIDLRRRYRKIRERSSSAE